MNKEADKCDYCHRFVTNPCDNHYDYRHNCDSDDDLNGKTDI